MVTGSLKRQWLNLVHMVHCQISNLILPHGVSHEVSAVRSTCKMCKNKKCPEKRSQSSLFEQCHLSLQAIIGHQMHGLCSIGTVSLPAFISCSGITVKGKGYFRKLKQLRVLQSHLVGSGPVENRSEKKKIERSQMWHWNLQSQPPSLLSFTRDWYLKNALHVSQSCFPHSALPASGFTSYFLVYYGCKSGRGGAMLSDSPNMESSL